MNSFGFMKVTTSKGSVLSAGCCSAESLERKYQKNHTDEIMVMSLTHNLSNIGNSKQATHGPVVIAKYLDKSSPLLAKALTSQEKLNCEINFYRNAVLGGEELFYTIEITDCIIDSLTLDVPHDILHNGVDPQEIVAFRYQGITWIHHKAGTLESTMWFPN